MGAGKSAYSEIAAAIEKIASENRNQIAISRGDQLLKLDKDFQDGKIKNVAAYNKAKENIEDDASWKLF